MNQNDDIIQVDVTLKDYCLDNYRCPYCDKDKVSSVNAKIIRYGMDVDTLIRNKCPVCENVFVIRVIKEMVSDDMIEAHIIKRKVVEEVFGDDLEFGVHRRGGLIIKDTGGLDHFFDGKSLEELKEMIELSQKQDNLNSIRNVLCRFADVEDFKTLKDGYSC